MHRTWLSLPEARKASESSLGKEPCMVGRCRGCPLPLRREQKGDKEEERSAFPPRTAEERERTSE